MSNIEVTETEAFRSFTEEIIGSMSLKTTLTALNPGIINNWLSQARRLSQKTASRYHIRTKRWSKGILFLKKQYIKKSHFSTVSQFAVPADYESDDVNTDEVPDQHKQFPITRKTAVKQSPDESVTHTTKLSIIDPALVKRWPMFSVLDRFGKCLPAATDPLIDKEKMIKMYTVMTRVQILDDIFFNAQRQGRISFYMQSCGEEATQIGAYRALHFYVIFRGHLLKSHSITAISSSKFIKR